MIGSMRFSEAYPVMSNLRPLRDSDFIADCDGACGQQIRLDSAYIEFSTDRTTYRCPDDGALLAAVDRQQDGSLRAEAHGNGVTFTSP